MSLRADKEHIVKKLIGGMVLSCLIGAALQAQEPAAAPRSKEAAARQVALKVQIVVSRLQGDKKVRSTPYTLAVIANDNDKTSIRMGADVPIPQTVLGRGAEGANSAPQVSYTYRTIGTNIDCSAVSREEGLFKLDIGIEDSSVFMAEKETASSTNAMPVAPTLRSFRSTFNLLLRDGQTAQHTAATDPVSGEVMRVDVTLTVIK